MLSRILQLPNSITEDDGRILHKRKKERKIQLVLKAIRYMKNTQCFIFWQYHRYQGVKKWHSGAQFWFSLHTYYYKERKGKKQAWTLDAYLVCAKILNYVFMFKPTQK